MDEVARSIRVGSTVSGFFTGCRPLGFFSAGLCRRHCSAAYPR